LVSLGKRLVVLKVDRRKPPQAPPFSLLSIWGYYTVKADSEREPVVKFFIKNKVYLRKGEVPLREHNEIGNYWQLP